MTDRFENQFIPPLVSKTYDCAKCGLCCIDIGGTLHVYPDDSEYWRQQGVTGLEEKFATTDAHHPCPFLTEGKPFRCTIYSLRPTVCHKFTNGDPSCVGLRKKHGLPV